MDCVIFRCFLEGPKTRADLSNDDLEKKKVVELWFPGWPTAAVLVMVPQHIHPKRYKCWSFGFSATCIHVNAGAPSCRAIAERKIEGRMGLDVHPIGEHCGNPSA